MSEEIEEQLKVMEQYTADDANVHQAFKEMTKLLKMFYEYLEKNKP